MTARIVKKRKSPITKVSKKLITKKVVVKSKSSIFYKYLRPVLIGLLIFLLLLLSVVLYTKMELLLKKSLVDKVYNPVYQNQVFYGLTEDNVQSITIHTVQETFVIKKSLNGWFIDDKKVKRIFIDRLFASLYEFDQGTLLSKNPKNLLELGISDLLGSFVTIESGSRRISFVIGNPSSVLNSFYFRLADSNEVFLSRGDLRNIVTISKSEWLSD